MSNLSTRINGLVMTLLLIFPISIVASDGRIEINQTSVEAAGGFPYSINQPGSYLLTGSLTVPADTAGIVIETPNVTLDLNGFQIAGPFVCEPGDCEEDVGGMTVDGVSANGQHSYVTVRNGQISGFSGQCLLIYQNSRVENLQIYSCRLVGILVSSYSSVFSNHVFNVGNVGIQMSGTGSVFAHNTVSNAALRSTSQPAIQGGKATAGNYCDDGRCRDTRKRFYLTEGSFDANDVLTACANGFHMGSLWEIREVSQFRYDTVLGHTRADSGEGPPTGVVGWIRTGYFNSGSSSPGRANCLGWDNATGDHNGTLLALPDEWDPDMDLQIERWQTETIGCNATGVRVWCVED